jgi:peptide chain release factor 1
MFDKLATEEQRYENLMRLLGTTEVQSDPSEYRKHAKALAEVEPLVERFREYRTVVNDIAQTEELAGDADMRDLAKAELKSLTARRDTLIAEMKVLLIPKDPNDEKNVMLEIRAGTGGDEAALFASDLFRMYSKFAERLGWRIEVMSSSDTGVGGVKEVIAMIEGRGAYSKLKYESGVHRVQRVPATEASGRVHTSTVTVAVLPERSTSRSTTRTCASTRSARAARAARASTPRTPPCGSRTSPPAWSSRNRTRSRRSRIARRR